MPGISPFEGIIAVGLGRRCLSYQISLSSYLMVASTPRSVIHL